MVDRGSKHITKEDGEHHTLRITSIHHTDDDGHSTNEEAIDILARCGAARGDRVGSHEHSTEGKATKHKVMPPSDRLTGLLEDACQHRTTYEHTQHGTPRGDAHPKQEAGTDGDGDDAGLTDRTGDKAADHVADRSIGVDALSDLTKRCGSGETIGQVVTQSENTVLSHPHLIARHLRWIGEEEEHTDSDGWVEDVHTRAAEDLLTEDDGEGAGQCQHPQWTTDRNDQRDDDTRGEVTLLDLLTLPLSPGKLDAETYDVADQNLRQYGEEAEAENLEERGRSQRACSEIVLIADIIHTKQHGWHQGDDHHTYNTLRVDGIVNIDTRLRSIIRHKRKCLKTIEDTAESMQLATLFEAWPHLVK